MKKARTSRAHPGRLLSPRFNFKEPPDKELCPLLTLASAGRNSRHVLCMREGWARGRTYASAGAHAREYSGSDFGQVQSKRGSWPGRTGPVTLGKTVRDLRAVRRAGNSDGAAGNAGARRRRRRRRG